MFRILVDADACPVTRIVEKVAKAHNIPVTLFCDTNHILNSDYSETKTVSAGADAVDFVIANECKSGDIVVTQDYGVAAMILSRGCYGIHQSGVIYTNENIDGLLAQRYTAKKARMAKAKNHLKGPSKRTPEDDKKFEISLESLIKGII